MPSTKTKKVLKDVRTLLTDPASWVQRSFGNQHSKCFCLVGAINYVQGRDPADFASSNDLAVITLANLITPDCPENSRDGTLLTWNDENHRTHTEVLALLDKAITS